MGASQFVGRVGGLAVALGVGAAVFGLRIPAGRRRWGPVPGLRSRRHPPWTSTSPVSPARRPRPSRTSSGTTSRITTTARRCSPSTPGSTTRRHRRSPAAAGASRSCPCSADPVPPEPPQPSRKFPFDAFLGITATPAKNALNVPVALKTGDQVVGAPQLSFSDSGLGTSRAVFAQIVEGPSTEYPNGRVIGSIVAAVPVTLDWPSTPTVPR